MTSMQSAAGTRTSIRPRTARWSICCSAPSHGSRACASRARFTLRLHATCRAGSGSSRRQPTQPERGALLQRNGPATLLFDLLTKHEQPIDEITRQLRFDIPLLSQRLTGVIDQLSSDAQLRELRIGLFGASTGAAAALTTAASRPADIAAVVSRGGASTSPSRHWHESTPLRCSSSAAATGGAGAQPCRRGTTAVRAPAGGGARREPPVRGARHAGRGGAPPATGSCGTGIAARRPPPDQPRRRSNENTVSAPSARAAVVATGCCEARVYRLCCSTTPG